MRPNLGKVVVMEPAYSSTQLGRMHYRREGAGESIVLLHPGLWDSNFWMRLGPVLAERCDVLAPDVPPVGQSEPQATEPSSLSEYTDSVIALLDALGIESATFSGYHVGSSIAVDAAARYPERVDRLVPIGLFAVGTRAERERFYVANVADPIPFLNDENLQDPKWLPRNFLDNEEPIDSEAYSKQLATQALVGTRAWWHYRATFDFDVADAMSKVSCPTLLLYLTGDTLTQAVAEEIP